MTCSHTHDHKRYTMNHPTYLQAPVELFRSLLSEMRICMIQMVASAAHTHTRRSFSSHKHSSVKMCKVLCAFNNQQISTVQLRCEGCNGDVAMKQRAIKNRAFIEVWSDVNLSCTNRLFCRSYSASFSVNCQPKKGKQSSIAMIWSMVWNETEIFTRKWLVLGIFFRRFVYSIEPDAFCWRRDIAHYGFVQLLPQG